MRILRKPKVYLIARPQIVEEGLQAFLDEQGLDWPTPTEGVTDAERLVELAGRCCFDDQTEILTNEGWKLFKNLNKNEKVLTLNPDSNHTEWQHPLGYQIYNFGQDDEKMFLADGRDISLCVTPDHRQLIQNKDGINEFITTSSIGKKVVKIHTAANGIGDCVIPMTVRLPGRTVQQVISNQYGSYGTKNINIDPIVYTTKEDIEALAKLITLYVTEGSLREPKTSGKGIVLYGTFAVDNGLLIAEQLCLPRSVGVDKRNNCPRLAIGGGITISDYFKTQCGSKSYKKKFPRWVLNLPEYMLREIWEILVRTDGHEYPNGRQVLITTSFELAGQCQEILAQIGHGSSISIEAGTNHPIYRVGRKNRDFALINKNVQLEQVDYKGKVYCVSTSNGVILVRRNGKVHFSGNCYMSYGKKAVSRDNHQYIQNLVGRNPDGSFRPGPSHGSVCEHPCWSFLIVGAGRGFSHEQCRHRAGWSYSQLSTRYCDIERSEAEEGTWDPGFCIPPMAQLSKDTAIKMEDMLAYSQKMYVDLLHRIEKDLQDNDEFMDKLKDLSERESKRTLRKAARGAARDILPIATEAIMTMSANARAIWNCITLRANEHAEAVIRDIYVQIAKIMEKEMPALFNGLEYVKVWDGSEAVVMPREKL